MLSKSSLKLFCYSISFLLSYLSPSCPLISIYYYHNSAWFLFFSLWSTTDGVARPWLPASSWYFQLLEYYPYLCIASANSIHNEYATCIGVSASNTEWNFSSYLLWHSWQRKIHNTHCKVQWEHKRHGKPARTGVLCYMLSVEFAKRTQVVTTNVRRQDSDKSEETPVEDLKCRQRSYFWEDDIEN